MALYNQHWETAKLILAIACAQYCPPESTGDTSPPKFVSICAFHDFVLMSHLTPNSAGDSDDSDDESMDVMEDEPSKMDVDLVDIANISSEVRVDAHPSCMLEASFPWIAKGGWAYMSCLMFQAILNDEYERFIKIFDLYASIPDWEIPSHIILSTVRCDRPEMLDICIRRTGQGIILDHDTRRPTIQPASSNSKRDIYLGLNIRGKKRKDLVAQVDPSVSPRVSIALPLVWEAASSGSKAVVRYLSSDRPLAAFAHYASTHENPRAKELGEASDLSAILPEKLGWRTTLLNETVVTAAAANGQVGVLEELSSILGATEMQAKLQLR